MAEKVAAAAPPRTLAGTVAAEREKEAAALPPDSLVPHELKVTLQQGSLSHTHTQSPPPPVHVYVCTADRCCVCVLLHR